MSIFLYWWKFWLGVVTPKARLKLVYTKRDKDD